MKGMSYRSACDYVRIQFQITTNRTALCEFWKKECLPLVLLQKAHAVESASRLAQHAETVPGRLAESSRDSIQQKFFRISLRPGDNTKELIALNELLMKERAMAVEEGRLAIAQRRSEREAEEYGAKQALRQKPCRRTGSDAIEALIVANKPSVEPDKQNTQPEGQPVSEHQ